MLFVFPQSSSFRYLPRSSAAPRYQGRRNDVSTAPTCMQRRTTSSSTGSASSVGPHRSRHTYVADICFMRGSKMWLTAAAAAAVVYGYLSTGRCPPSALLLASAQARASRLFVAWPRRHAPPADSVSDAKHRRSPVVCVIIQLNDRSATACCRG